MSKYTLKAETAGDRIFNVGAFFMNDVGKFWLEFCSEKGYDDVKLKETRAEPGIIQSEGVRCFSKSSRGRIVISPVLGEDALPDETLFFNMSVTGVRPALSYVGIGKPYKYSIKCTVMDGR